MNQQKLNKLIKKMVKKIRRKTTPRKNAILAANRYCGFWIKGRDRKRGCPFHPDFSYRPGEVWYHLIPASCQILRWHPWNSIAACSACNYGEMLHRLSYRQKHMDLIGKEKYAFLESLIHTIAKFSTEEIIEIGEQYKLKYERQDFSDFVPEPIAQRIENGK